MNVSDFDYHLPEELIAQRPCERRDGSRLLVVDRKTGEMAHRHFYDITEYLEPGDCLVLNDSRVLPARLNGIKEGTGARIEFLLTKRIEGDIWQTMVRPGRRLKEGDRVLFFSNEVVDNNNVNIDTVKRETVDESARDNAMLTAVILGTDEGGTRRVKFEYDGIFMERLEEIGSMPLPPYIDRQAGDDDKERYQTVYAAHDGSVAAPTAGLHFTDELLKDVAYKGVNIAKVTLHVGIGTFRPVKVDKVEDHHMHFEEYEISEEAANTINTVRREGGRIISVGTTATRTLESATVHCENNGYLIKPGAGSTDIFIYPGYEFRIIDSLITNFHLPKSTLMMLISAFYDREKILEVYEEAVKEKYRFFSYGDAMLIL